MLQKRASFIICCVVMSVLWFVVGFVLFLRLDSPEPHPMLEAFFRILHFPSILFPYWESWDSRTAVMSENTWRWYYDFGETIDWAFWGVGIVWLYRVVERRFISRRTRAHGDAA